MLFNATQNFGTVYFAQNNVASTHAGDAIDHAPTVAMELWKRVQVHIAIVDTHLPTESCCVQPQVAMRELHTFGSSRCATRVVDRCGGVFIGNPGFGFNPEAHENLIRCSADDEFVFALNGFHCFNKFGVNE